MLLFPRRTKYKKCQKGRHRFNKKEMNYILPKFGFYGLKIQVSSKVKSNTIEAARKAIRKRIKRKYTNPFRINLFSDLNSTKKSSGVRMGKGKGNVDFWYSYGNKGRILVEINRYVPRGIAKNALTSVGFKFSKKCKFVDLYKNLT